MPVAAAGVSVVERDVAPPVVSAKHGDALRLEQRRTRPRRLELR